MKPIRTPQCDVTLTLKGGTEDNDLPAQRAMLYDTSIGETQEDARLGFVTRWMPDEEEARRLEAGAVVELTVFGKGHPPVSLGVSEAVVPWAELVQRDRVERALGKLYADLAERAEKARRAAIDHVSTDLRDTTPIYQLVAALNDALPDHATFADLWRDALDQTREQHERGERARRIIDPRGNGG